MSSPLFASRGRLLALALLLSGAAAAAEPSATIRETDATGKVVASGTVPDGGTKAAILSRLREIYGAAQVVDNLTIDNVVMPPNWPEYVTKLISPDLKSIHHGQLAIDGTNVSVRGDVSSEAARQQLVSDMATRLNPTYVVKSGLRTAVSSQSVLDQTLANRIIEFEPGQATLTAKGQSILDEMAEALKSLGSQKLLIVGHTDPSGSANANIQLSLARANAVKAYFAGKGIDTSAMNTSGAGSSRPVAPNTTPEGRARNRRIEFKIIS